MNEKKTHESRRFRRLRTEYGTKLGLLVKECKEDLAGADSETVRKKIIRHFDHKWHGIVKKVANDPSLPLECSPHAFRNKMDEIQEDQRRAALLEGNVRAESLLEIGFQEVEGSFLNRRSKDRVFLSNELCVVISPDGYVSIRRDVNSPVICGAREYSLHDFKHLLQGLHIQAISQHKDLESVLHDIRQASGRTFFYIQLSPLKIKFLRGK